MYSFCPCGFRSHSFDLKKGQYYSIFKAHLRIFIYIFVVFEVCTNMLSGLCKNLKFTSSPFPNPIFTLHAQFSGCMRKVYTIIFTFLRSVGCTLHKCVH